MLRRARKRLGVLLEPLNRADNAVNFLADFIICNNWLFPVVKRLYLLIRPLRAVAIAPRYLLLLNLQPLAVEVGGLGLDAFFQFPKAVLPVLRVEVGRPAAARAATAGLAVAGEINDICYGH